MRNKKWTEEEDKKLIDAISKNPNNLAKALREAARSLGRSFGACHNRWYGHILKRDKAGICFVTIGRKTRNINRKIVSEASSNNTQKSTVSWWKKLLTLLKK